MTKAIYIFLTIAIILGLTNIFLTNRDQDKVVEPVAVAEVDTVPPELIAEVAAKADLITVDGVGPYDVLAPGQVLTGQARGPWYSEASFPVYVTNWDGLIIGEGFATAAGEWMTVDFVPFTTTLDFVNPYNPGDPDFMKFGSLILKKDNPSGLPEYDDALEFRIKFAL